MRAIITVLLLSACSSPLLTPPPDGGPVVGDAGVPTADGGGVPDSGQADAPTPAQDAPEAVDAGTDVGSAPDAPEGTDGGGAEDAGVGVDAPVAPARPVGAPRDLTDARCALDELGTAWCWDELGELDRLGHPFVDVGGRCAAREDGTVACASPSGSVVEVGLHPGAVLEGSTASTGCTNTGTDLHCWNSSRTCTWTGMGDVIVLLPVNVTDACAPTTPGELAVWGWSAAYPDRTPIAMGWAWRPNAGGIDELYTCRVYRLVGGGASNITECRRGALTYRLPLPSTALGAHPLELELNTLHGVYCAVIDGVVTCADRNTSSAWYRTPGTTAGLVADDARYAHTELCVWNGALTCYAFDASAVALVELYAVAW